MIKNLVAIATLLGASSFTTEAKPMYQHAKTDVLILSQLNFEKQVSKNRDKGISIVHYYKSSGKLLISF
jgi:hypothetical protein